MFSCLIVLIAHFYSNAMQLGDFVHIRNDSDPSKPIIGLIFSLWEDAKYVTYEASIVLFRIHECLFPA